MFRIRLLPVRTFLRMGEYPRTMSKTALVLATDGSEEIELLATVDILRRANVVVTIAGLPDHDVLTLSRQVKVQVDKRLKDVVNENFDAVVLPGGPGHKDYGTDKNVGDILKRHESNGKILAAICAGPIGFKAHSIAPGAAVCCYPSVEEDMKSGGYKVSQDNVVVSSSVNTGSGSASILTSRGPGTTFEFALKIVELLAGDEVATSVRKALLL